MRMSSTDNTTALHSVINEPVTHYKSQFVGLSNDPAESQCLLCDLTFTLPTNEKQFLSHLFEKHRLIIGDVDRIASLRSYVHYWKIKFKEAPLTTFCTTMLMDCTPDGKPSKDEVYYLLSDCISEDRTLRDELSRSKLEWALAQQDQERTDKNFKRGCLFCRTEVSGLRIEYLKHLASKHNFYLGKHENLVFVDKLLDQIQRKIDELRCIYCEKLFKDRNVLKEHMRKKLHKRINPNNKEYDQFYISNYVIKDNILRQKPQNKFDGAEEPDGCSDNESEESSWADWNCESIDVMCLFCPEKSVEFSPILEHMITKHNFNFEQLTKDLNFYSKVKVVNYIRRQTSNKTCIYCDEQVENILDHMRIENHNKLPSSRIWNQPEFYFPINEMDSFLYHLDSTSDDEGEGIEEL